MPLNTQNNEQILPEIKSILENEKTIGEVINQRKEESQENKENAESLKNEQEYQETLSKIFNKALELVDESSVVVCMAGGNKEAHSDRDEEKIKAHWTQKKLFLSIYSILNSGKKGDLIQDLSDQGLALFLYSSDSNYNKKIDEIDRLPGRSHAEDKKYKILLKQGK